MKVLKKNNLIKKIAIIILFVMCFNILIPSGSVTAKSWAGETADEDTDYTPGGSLFQPIMDFLVFLADSILNILQHNFITMWDVVYSPTSESNGTFSWGWLGVALIAIVAIAYGVSVVYTAGASLSALPTILTGCAWIVGGGYATIHAFGELSDLMAGEFDVPYIMYNPYSIFSGDIPALDINFINPRENVLKDKPTEGEATEELLSDENLEKFKDIIINEDEIYTDSFNIWANLLGENEEAKNALISFKEEGNYEENIENVKTIVVEEERINEVFYNQTSYTYIYVWEDGQNLFFIKHYHYYYSSNLNPENLKTTDRYWTYKCTDIEAWEMIKKAYIEENTTYYESSAAILQSSIATWYKVLRRVALVGLLSVLVYVGIRIILTAAAADKAKYKKMFIDWLVAVCMLFVLHYIMILILTLSTNLTEIFNKVGALNMVFELPADSTVGNYNLSDLAEQPVESDYASQYSNITVGTDEDGNPCPLWNGEFMGYIRLKAGSSWVRNQMAYGLMYLVLVIYVCTFTFMYLRRVLYMAFLTMIAPLIALTYPIDRIKDGQAQAFGMWLREYIFNALIQPVHLIIYTMVLSTVINLAVDHPVYALVALGFMLPAERFIRSMFGFQKASTLDKAGGVLGGAALMTAVSKLSKLGKKKGDKKEDTGKDHIRTADKDKQGIDLPDVDVGGDSGNVRMNNRNSTIGAHELGDSNTQARTQNNPQANTSWEEDDEGYNYYLNGYQHLPNAQKEEKPKEEKTQNNTQNTRAQSDKSKASIIWNRFKNGTASMSNRAKNRILKAKPLRTVGRFTAMAAGAATLGTVGLAAGIATGDFGSVMKATGTGVGVGAALGRNIGDRAMDKASEIKENFQEGYMGREEYNNEKLDREYFRGQGYQEMLDNSSLMPHLSGGERARALKQEIENYRASGLTDNKQIASCMKAGLSSEEGVCALQISNKLKGMNLDSKGKEAYKEAYKQQLGNQFDSSKVDSIWNVIEANM